MSEIEYFYSAHSAFAYLGSKRFMEIAKAAGRTIVHKPYDLTRGRITYRERNAGAPGGRPGGNRPGGPRRR